MPDFPRGPVVDPGDATVGLCLGRAASVATDTLLGRPTEPSRAAAAIACGMSLLVGVAFGYYPAWRASRMNPIEALRYE